MSLRLIALGALLALVLTSATITFAAQGPTTAPQAAAPVAKTPPAELVVPDVRRQAYVFAKGILEEAGFAWRVQGSVQGFAANQVATQHPAPGSRLVDTGAPLVTLTLSRNSRYGQDGTPENASVYRATAVVLAGAASVRAAPVASASEAQSKPRPKKTPKPEARKLPQRRPAAFVVAGAPSEPLDEITLPDRAHQLEAWLVEHPKLTPANVDHWLYQHSWIVTGAKFGWFRGAEALRLLMAIDERAQRQWGVGSLSRDVARSALAEVEARSR